MVDGEGEGCDKAKLRSKSLTMELELIVNGLAEDRRRTKKER